MSEAWVTIAVDQIECSVIIAGFGKTKKECKQHSERVDTPYVKTFQLMPKVKPQEMYDWMCRCGIPRDEARNVVRQVGKEILEILSEVEEQRK